MKTNAVTYFCKAQWGRLLRKEQGLPEEDMGRPSKHALIREVLRAHPEGLTAKEVGAKVKSTQNHAYNAMRAMPDVYIDRWVQLKPNTPYSAVWCVIEVPEDCPKPSSRWPSRKKTDHE